MHPYGMQRQGIHVRHVIGNLDLGYLVIQEVVGVGCGNVVFGY